MEVKDLMIDDYVQFYDGRICQVEDIYHDDVVEIRTKEGCIGNLYNAMCDRIYPIRINKKILEKNGFKKSNESDDHTLTLWLDKTFYIEYLMDNNAILVCTEQYDYDAYCYYVHELQHVMRLCKIKKEIKL